MTNSYQAIVRTPFGAIGMRCANGKISAIDFLPESTMPDVVEPACRDCIDRLQAYFKNSATSLDIPTQITGTPFQRRVWEAIRQIPAGTTLTYGQLASKVNSGPRAVANACGANPVPLIIPCHRVVATHGIGGFMGGRSEQSLRIKSWLLAHESRHATTAG